MSDLVGNPEDRFSRVAAHIVGICSNQDAIFVLASDTIFWLVDLEFNVAQTAKVIWKWDLGL